MARKRVRGLIQLTALSAAPMRVKASSASVGAGRPSASASCATPRCSASYACRTYTDTHAHTCTSTLCCAGHRHAMPRCAMAGDQSSCAEDTGIQVWCKLGKGHDSWYEVLLCCGGGLECRAQNSTEEVHVCEHARHGAAGAALATMHACMHACAHVPLPPHTHTRARAPCAASRTPPLHPPAARRAC